MRHGSSENGHDPIRITPSRYGVGEEFESPRAGCQYTRAPLGLLNVPSDND